MSRIGNIHPENPDSDTHSRRQTERDCLIRARVLILFIMPDDESQWLAQSDDELCLRKCSYWVSLMGMQPSRNSSTVRVRVPLANVFDQDGLRDMFRQLIG